MIERDDLGILVARETPRPCVSLYQPTHRHHPSNAQDPIRFQNLVKQADASLRLAHDDALVDAMLAPFRDLAGNADFWNHTRDGLAVFGAPGLFRVVRLQRPVDERMVVAGTFHVAPLLRIVQSADRYQVLALSRESIRLFEGNRDVLDEIEPAPGVPRTIADALGDELTERQMQVHSYGTGPAASGAGSRRNPGGLKTGGVRHGHGSRKDEIDDDTARFFRAVDRAVLEHHSRPGGLPLILAGLPEHHAPFRAVSRNPHVVEGGIEGNVDALSLDALRDRAWAVMEPAYRARLAGLVERYGALQAAGRADDRLPEVSVATAAGRVETLLVEAGRLVPGRADPQTGVVIEADELYKPDVDDLLDDVAQRVLQAGGEVVIVPPDRMPTPTGLAALYRY